MQSDAAWRKEKEMLSDHFVPPPPPFFHYLIFPSLRLSEKFFSRIMFANLLRRSEFLNQARLTQKPRETVCQLQPPARRKIAKEIGKISRLINLILARAANICNFDLELKRAEGET